MAKAAILGLMVSVWPALASAQHLQMRMTPGDARHLLERAGLGAHPDEINALLGLSRAQAIDAMVDQLDVSAPFNEPPISLSDGEHVHYWMLNDYEEQDRQAFRVERDKEMGELRRWWIREMLSTSSPAGERLLLIWSNHFVSAYGSLNEEVHALYNQHMMLREKGHGRFRDLLRAVVRDAAMLNYLDNNNSREEQPNENLARELLELFVLGEGQYTEMDVKEVARALTGYSYNDLRDFEFQFQPWDHDEGSKRILGKIGRFDADDVIDILLETDAAAAFIVGTFWQAYISEFEKDPAAIEALATDWRKTDYDISALVRIMLSSEEFWDPRYRGTIVKSPVDLMIGTLRSGGRLPQWWPTLSVQLESLGQHLFEAPNVAGWPGGADWITPARLLSRNEALQQLAALYDGPAPSAASDPAGTPDGLAADGMMTPLAGMPLSLRYGAEDFEGPPTIVIRGYKTREDGRDIPIWRSEVFEASGGIDTGRLGRIDSLADLNWQVDTLVYPEDLDPPDWFSVGFYNDHCCGPGGSSGGDRNLFIDWLRFDDQLYLASDGLQKPGCRGSNNDDPPGNFYCSGELQLRVAQTLEPEPMGGSGEDLATSALNPDRQDRLVIGRVAFDWGRALDRTRSWNSLSISLMDVRMNHLHYDALRLELVEHRRNGRRELLLDIRESNCRPDCFYGQWPSTTFKEFNSGEKRVEYLLWPGGDVDQRGQYDQLDEDHRKLVHGLWSAMPTLFDTMKDGRNWRRRGQDRVGSSWDPILAKITDALPRTRYSKELSNPVPLIEPMAQNSGSMMSAMMSQEASGAVMLLGMPDERVEWLGSASGAERFEGDALVEITLAGRPSRPLSSGFGFSDLIIDPVYQLK
ncbi:MAG: hypothetical protein CMM70_09965 [Rhodospirillaceae bacterium]|nr:hypothetical protein [Rhodospirillaceae bacterium]MAV48171.1 hypothetical protein [Rhodospirillaceae bacterium]